MSEERELYRGIHPAFCSSQCREKSDRLSFHPYLFYEKKSALTITATCNQASQELLSIDNEKQPTESQMCLQ